MSNCRASLGHVNILVNVFNAKEVYNSLYAILDNDNDLTENVDYFNEFTLELGYDNEADRIVKETLLEHRLYCIEHYNSNPKDFERMATKDFERMAIKVSDHITKQEYYGQCDISFVKINDGQVVMSFVYGGDYGN